MEEWKDIKGYEGKYQVSSHGRVKSLNYKNTGIEKIMKQAPNRGYMQIHLYSNSKRKSYTIHRLVAEAFLDNPDNFSEVNHKDEDKSNNRVENLEWCDHKYNANYGTKVERTTKKNKGKFEGQNNPMYGKQHSKEAKNKIAKSRMKKVKCATTGEIFDSIKEARIKYNINKGDISRCCKGKLKTAGGYKWEYIE